MKPQQQHQYHRQLHKLSQLKPSRAAERTSQRCKSSSIATKSVVANHEADANQAQTNLATADANLQKAQNSSR